MPEFPNLAPEILERMRRNHQEWEEHPAPCGISHDDPYNPCLVERDARGLLCVTCGLRQKPIDRSCRE
jgi:hypothetical protein